MSTTTITTISPDDVRSWRHSDAKFVMMLSGVCGWTARLGGKGGQLHSKSGQTMLIPDNTGLKMAVFRSWCSRIMTHADRKPTSRVVFELMEECRLDPSHRKAAWASIGLDPYVPPAPAQPASPAPGVDQYKVMNQGRTVFTADNVEAAIELAMEALTPVSGQFTVVEIASGKTVQRLEYQPLADKPGVATIMPWVTKGRQPSPAVMERTWTDGHVDFVCAHPGCEVSADKAMSIVGHYKVHSARKGEWKRGRVVPPTPAAPPPVAQPAEAPSQQRNSAGSTPAGGTFNPMAVSGGGSHVERDEPNDTDVVSNSYKLQRIVDIVAPGLLAEISRLHGELDAAVARAEAAELKLETLRSLITGTS